MIVNIWARNALETPKELRALKDYFTHPSPRYEAKYIYFKSCFLPFSSYWLSTDGIFIDMTFTVAMVADVAAKIG